MRLGSSNARKVLLNAASTSRCGARTSPSTVKMKARIRVAEVMIVVPIRSRRRLMRSARTPASSWKTTRSEEHTSELQSLAYLVCRLLLEKKKQQHNNNITET